MAVDPQETPEETLARLQRQSRPSTPQAATPGTARYSPPLSFVRIKEGYRVEDVDTFLDGVASRTPDEVRSARFGTVRLVRGYDEDMVDALLDDIVTWLEAGQDVRSRLAHWTAPTHR